MSFKHADDVPDGSTLHTEICVVGSGAAGLTLARELDGTGTTVLVLEAGGLERDRAIEDEAFQIEHLGVPYRNPCPTRGRWFGGSTNLWFGRIAMLDPIDLEQRTWVPYSGWPLSHDELIPWMRKAARILDVPNFDRIQIENWAGDPTVEMFVDRGGANLGVFVWANGLYMGPFYRDTLNASRNVSLMFNATATELVPDATSGAIESLEVRGSSDNSFKVVATIYVLAAGGLENPRLLLASTRRSESGIGNGHDLVGRFYMDHPRTQGLASVDLRNLSVEQLQRLQMLGEHVSPKYGRAQFRVTFPPSMQRDEALLNHSLHADFASDVHASNGYQAVRRWSSLLRGKRVDAIGQEITWDLANDLRATLKDAPELLAYGVQKIRKRAHPTRMFLHDQMEQEPDPSSRVTVDWNIRDRWKLPKLQLDWRIAESTYRSQLHMHRLFKEVLERSDIKTFHSPLLDEPDEPPTLMEMKHPSGTTRMNPSPTLGVVDANLCVHESDNLYIVGSSVFPTVGHANPTLLIVALAARLAEHLRLRA